MADGSANNLIYSQFPLAIKLRREEKHLDEVGGLGYFAVPDICAVDEKQPVVGLDPAIQGGDGVLQDFHYEYSRLGAAPRDPAGVSSGEGRNEMDTQKI